jgi:transcriptional regulator with XRE-family HTH domain
VPDWRKETVDRLRDLRRRNGLTQEAFAELSGLGFKFYQAIEAGRKSNLTLATLHKIAEAYGIGIHQLLAPRIPRTRLAETAVRGRRKSHAKAKSVNCENKTAVAAP